MRPFPAQPIIGISVDLSKSTLELARDVGARHWQLHWRGFDAMPDGRTGQGIVDIRLHLMMSAAWMSTRQVLVELKGRGLRSCALHHLLSLGPRRPELPAMHEIACLKHELYPTQDCDAFLRYDGECVSMHLHHHDLDNAWNPGAIFPAVDA